VRSTWSDSNTNSSSNNNNSNNSNNNNNNNNDNAATTLQMIELKWQRPRKQGVRVCVAVFVDANVCPVINTF